MVQPSAPFSSPLCRDQCLGSRLVDSRRSLQRLPGGGGTYAFLAVSGLSRRCIIPVDERRSAPARVGETFRTLTTYTPSSHGKPQLFLACWRRGVGSIGPGAGGACCAHRQLLV